MRWRRLPAGVAEAALPSGALLGRYVSAGSYTDCFVVTVPGSITQAAYVEAFYTTPLFKLERLALAVLLWFPSTDQQARCMAAGEISRFAAWTVEGREADQILLCDFLGASRSWLMSVADGATGTTTLYFGTALLPHPRGDRLGLGFRALVPFHRPYARALLRSAVRRLAVRPA
ncbi:hypothetical protein [Brevundimonas lenta]|uniref:DUF2867 domain-containing protein n=1 Tax=Brevundimonas lenta TaxID=424796 RepID=A0A7W6JFW8_9CAUL|nr:hypothetical protein [Brevundimonas lenta]MBB4083367.1 hypothetical protein [Brevundimonas lenta]